MPLLTCPYGAISKMKKPELYKTTQDIICENIKLKEENKQLKQVMLHNMEAGLDNLNEMCERNKKLKEENKKLKEENDKSQRALSKYINNLIKEKEELIKEISRLKELVEGERVYRERKCDLCKCEYYITEEEDVWVDSGTCQDCN